MSLSLVKPQNTELKPRIVVFGVGGAGGNAVNNMIDAGLEGVEFVVANTDAQHLSFAKTDRRIQLGETITQGLGAGAHPEVGMNAAVAEEAIRRLPAAVTLAFSPYAARADFLLDQAKAKGMELLVALPLEPAGHPTINNAGNRAGRPLSALSTWPAATPTPRRTARGTTMIRPP